MRLGIFTAIYNGVPRRRMLDSVVKLGVDTVEIGTGNYPGSDHCDPDELLGDAAALRRFRRDLESRELTISALSQHGNPLHPREAVALSSHRTWVKTVHLAAELGVETVIAFSGCPGDGPAAQYPNWVTCAWPEEYVELVEWQWEARAIPYWQEQVELARAHGVRVAIEMHPGFLVYNPATLLRLREATGPELGVNFDPSHLFWQGIDPAAAIAELAGALFHVHAKDTFVDPPIARVDGPLDTTPLELDAERAWKFRTVGDGHGAKTWQAIVRALQKGGYDGALSIEHEDPLLAPFEGLARAVEFLRGVLEGPSRGAGRRARG
ncbi:MAG: sugar phosphate isomerase/epimerase family protein [Gaiellaceae bacterium]